VRSSQNQKTTGEGKGKTWKVGGANIEMGQSSHGTNESKEQERLKKGRSDKGNFGERKSQGKRHLGTTVKKRRTSRLCKKCGV